MRSLFLPLPKENPLGVRRTYTLRMRQRHFLYMAISAWVLEPDSGVAVITCVHVDFLSARLQSSDGVSTTGFSFLIYTCDD
jgi:hypothetical protein